MLHVLTNSFTSLGLIRDLRIALAAMNNLDAQLHRQPIEGPVRDMLADLVGNPRLRAFLSLSIWWPMSIKPCLVQWEIKPGFAPCSMTRRRARFRPIGDHPPDVHVPRIQRSRRWDVSGRRRHKGSISRTEVLMYITPRSWHH